MRMQGVAGLFLAATVAPALAAAQAPTIQHDAVGCIVAGQYPQLNACFTPNSNVARARVYFRVEAGPHWYFVDMKTTAPCWTGVLPKPLKATKKINYYLEVVDRAFAESRTEEYAPDVMPDAGSCRKDKPIASGLAKASVSVGAVGGAPVVPLGFAAGGIAGAGGSSLLIAGVVAGAGAGAAGIAAGTGGGDTTSTVATTQPAASSTTTTQAAATTTTTSSTTTTTSTIAKPFLFSLKVAPSPPKGTEPLAVSFNMCGSIGSSLRYSVDFESDGTEDFHSTTQCNATATYVFGGVFGLTPATTLPPVPPKKGFTARACVQELAGGGHGQCANVNIEVQQSGAFTIQSSETTAPARRLGWVSQLDVAGGAGQVIVNGQAVSYAGRGRSAAVALGRRGENRVEATVVQAAGQPGTWRFELGATPSLEPGSLRIVAGEVELVTADALVFRLSGKPGERVVFTFRTGR